MWYGVFRHVIFEMKCLNKWYLIWSVLWTSITKSRESINTCVQYSEEDYILCMTSRLFVTVHSICLLTLFTLTCFTPHSNDMTSWQIVRQRRSCATSRHFFLSPQRGDTTYCILHPVSDTLLSLNSKENVQNVR